MSPQVSGTADRMFLIIVTWMLTQATNKGWLSTSDIAVLAPALAAVPAIIIAWFKNRPQNIAADLAQVTADKVPGSPVKGVVTTDTMAGRDLANAITGPTVAAAGSQDAKKLATSGAPA